MTRRPFPLLALTLACAPLVAGAQDATPPPDGWTGTGELGFALSRGNARSENLNARLAFGKESARWKHDWFVATMRAKGESTGDFDGDGIAEERYELNANRYELGASSAYKLDERNFIVGSGRYENDDFAPYDYQATVSLNYGRKFLVGERTRLSGEIGPGYRRARDAATGEIDSGAIVRGRLDFAHQLTANTELSNVLLVEAGSDNTYAQNDLGVAVAMNEAFALKAGLQLRHNSDVPADGSLRKTDTLTTLNLVYNCR